MTIEKVDSHDVFIPTELGNEELKSGTTRLSRSQLELLVRLDGKATLAEIIAKAGEASRAGVLSDAQSLADAGEIEMARPGMDVEIDFSYFFGEQKSEPSADALRAAEPEAQAGTSALSLNGYYVSIARRAADKKPVASGAKYSVLAVEDDAELQRLLRFLLTTEGFAASIAGNRDEILAALRRLPSPDVVLLDVVLPDVNGFAILAKIRSHPALKAIPVVMLTSKATRDDVLRGLAGGADGYITKPFDPEKLIAGVRAVLGLG